MTGKPALEAYLASRNQGFASKVEELRDVIRAWLGYIPNTFPHYTSHALDHSNEIIAQVSKLLFTDDDPAQPVVALSAVEAYIVCLSALLHDAGMVASDSEKAEILASDSWREWVADEDVAARWNSI